MPWCIDWGPTSLENWRGCLSVPRKVQLDSENNLCMYPVKEVESLISQTVTYTDMEIGEKAIKLYDDPNRSNRIILKLLRLNQEIWRFVSLEKNPVIRQFRLIFCLRLLLWIRATETTMKVVE